MHASPPRPAAPAPGPRPGRTCAPWRALLRRHRATPPDDRGDVPGWVMVTLMTAGLVVAVWQVAEARLVTVFDDAISSVVGGP